MMKAVNILKAKPLLSRVIAISGKPLVKVIHLDGPESGQMSRLGFMSGQDQRPG